VCGLLVLVGTRARTEHRHTDEDPNAMTRLLLLTCLCCASVAFAQSATPTPTPTPTNTRTVTPTPTDNPAGTECRRLDVIDAGEDGYLAYFSTVWPPPSTAGVYHRSNLGCLVSKSRTSDPTYFTFLSVMWFRASELPDDAIILNATLRLYIQNVFHTGAAGRDISAEWHHDFLNHPPIHVEDGIYDEGSGDAIAMLDVDYLQTDLGSGALNTWYLLNPQIINPIIDAALRLTVTGTGPVGVDEEVSIGFPCNDGDPYSTLSTPQLDVCYLRPTATPSPTPTP
jgi:hypothetical protein